MALTHGGDIFAIARRHGWDWRDVLDFSANINPLGPASGVRAAICGAVDRIVHYPEREPSALKHALARKWDVSDGQILFGNGATELIFFLMRALAKKKVTLAVPVFSEFHRAIPDAALVGLTDAAAWPNESLLVLTRPANPTGHSFPLDVLERRLNESPDAVIVDESFLEFSGLPSVTTLLHSHPQLIVLRSLTKFYALPGLRVGAIVSSIKNIEKWKQIREPWQVNVLAEEAALAALADEPHASRSFEFMQSERKWLLHELRNLPHTDAAETDANFIHVQLPYPAHRLCQHLLAQLILIRDCGGWPGVNGESVRVAVRTRPENERLIAAWREL